MQRAADGPVSRIRVAATQQSKSESGQAAASEKRLDIPRARNRTHVAGQLLQMTRASALPGGRAGRYRDHAHSKFLWQDFAHSHSDAGDSGFKLYGASGLGEVPKFLARGP